MQEENFRIQTDLTGLKNVDDVKEFLKEHFVPLTEQVASLRSKYDKQVQRKFLLYQRSMLENVEMRNTIESMSKQMTELSEVIGKLKKKVEILKISAPISAGGGGLLVSSLLLSSSSSTSRFTNHRQIERCRK